MKSIILKTSLFSFFLIPISVSGISINYSFVFYCLFIFFYRKKIIKPPKFVTIFLIYLIGIFLFSHFLTLYSNPYLLRSLVSFLIFISIFSFSYVNIKKDEILAFKYSLIFISLIFSFSSIYTTLHLGISSGADAKVLVGSQRIGFIYLCSIWILFLSENLFKGFIQNKLRFLGIIIIFIGLLLTFSRSSIVSLIISIFFYLAIKFKYLFKINFKTSMRLLVVSSLIVYTTFFILPEISFFADFYSARLFNLILSGELLNNLSDMTSSEGQRLTIWGQIFNKSIENPFFSNSFLGYWSLKGSITGSSHNQILDVLLRTGILGTIFYLYLLYVVSRTLFIKHFDLFLAFFSVLVYGLFHETFKESHGAFMLSFFIGILSNERQGLYLKNEI